MFKVIVLACSVMSPETCWEWHDLRGPYEDRNRCVSRAHEMGNDIAQTHKGKIMPRSYKCKLLAPGRLT